MFLTGSALNGAAIRAPRISSKNLVSIIFCEATAIYGVIMAIILKAQIGTHPKAPETEMDWANMQYGGYALFTAGLGVGLTNLFRYVFRNQKRDMYLKDTKASNKTCIKKSDILLLYF